MSDSLTPPNPVAVVQVNSRKNQAKLTLNFHVQPFLVLHILEHIEPFTQFSHRSPDKFTQKSSKVKQKYDIFFSRGVMKKEKEIREGRRGGKRRGKTEKHTREMGQKRGWGGRYRTYVHCLPSAILLRFRRSPMVRTYYCCMINERYGPR